MSYEDQESNNSERNWVDKEPESIAKSIGCDTVSVGPEGHEDVGWSNEEQRDGVVVAKSRSQGWEEVLEASHKSMSVGSFFSQARRNLVAILVPRITSTAEKAKVDRMVRQNGLTQRHL